MNLIYTLLHLWLGMSIPKTSMITEYPKCIGSTFNQIIKVPGTLPTNIAVNAGCAYRVVDLRSHWRASSTGGWVLVGSLTQTPPPDTTISLMSGTCINDSGAVIITGVFLNNNGTPANIFDDQYCEINVTEKYNIEDKSAPEIAPISIITPYSLEFTAENLKMFFTSAYLSDNCTPLDILRNNLELIPDATRPLDPLMLCGSSNVYRTRIRTRDACGNYSPFVNLRVQYIDTVKPFVVPKADTTIYINSFCQARITPDLYRVLLDNVNVSSEIRSSHRILSPGLLHGNIPAGGKLIDRSYICTDADRRIKVRVCAQDCFGNGNLFLASDEIGSNCAIAIVNLRDASPAVCPCVTCSEDYEALKALYRSTDGAHWTHTWDTTDCTVDDWYGVIMDMAGRVKSLDLQSNHLNGVLPPEIGNLTHLNVLYLYENELRGNIPDTIGSLPLLQELYLDHNQLTGTIPSQFNQLVQLKILHLEYNQLSSAHLGAICALTDLYHLDMSNNLIVDTIPNEIGNLSSLRLLYLDHNQFFGSVPRGLGFLEHIQFLHLNDNHLNGCFHIDLHRLCDLPLEYDFTHNPDLPGGGNFTAFCEDHNTGACCSPDWATLKAFYRATNGGGWDIQWDTTDCTLYHWYGVKTDQEGRVTSIQLIRNNLNGTLPSVIGNLSKLQNLYLAFNNLSGPIPAEIGSLLNLKVLDLRRDQLNGSIPPEIGQLSQLQQLILSNNELTGAIPAEIGLITHLTYLNLSGNHFTTLSPSASSLRSNQFMGSIPGELGNLSLLQFLDLSYNQLNGSIPSQFANLSHLEYLNLSNNHLTGCIPNSFNNFCNRIVVIDFSHNDDLPFKGDFSKFCKGGAGACTEESCALVCHGNITVDLDPSSACEYIVDGTEFDLIRADCPITSLTYELRGDTHGTGGNTLAGVHLNMGVTSVIWTVNGGNSCFTTITVRDVTPPVITCPPSLTVYTDEGSAGVRCRYEISGGLEATSADLCNIIARYSVQLTNGDEIIRREDDRRFGLSGLYLRTGNTTIIWTTTDAAGNTARCSFIVTVLDSTPIISTTLITACGSYRWNGVTYIHSGTYDRTLILPEGCDSIARLILTITPPLTWYLDEDGDGFYSDIKVACESPGPGYITASVSNGDCNDKDAGIHPGAPDNNCNGKDDDCDGKIDEDYIAANCKTCVNGKEVTTLTTYYQDQDADGYGNLQVTKQSCTNPEGYVKDNTDCNDSDKTIHPGAADNTCNGKDDDCDGKIDEDYVAANCTTCASGKEVTNLTSYYQDQDGDGYGNPQVIKQSCTDLEGYVKNNTDCNDSDKTIHPGAADNTCNGKDDDCDGRIDEDYVAANCTTCVSGKEVTNLTSYYQDQDGDGYGNPQVIKQSCTDLSGYVKNNSDCNDSDKTIHPGASDNTCNGKDDDCDGKIDEDYVAANCTTCVNGKEVTNLTNYYQDQDGDGYGNPQILKLSCTDLAGYVKNNSDCNDSDKTIHPGAADNNCNGKDDDCDGKIDEDYVPKNCTTCKNGIETTTLTTWYIDFDKDGYGNPAVSLLSCEMPSGYVKNNTDCNDKDTKINPAAIETCKNGIDDNCDGKVDENCAPFAPDENPKELLVNKSSLSVSTQNNDHLVGINLYPNPSRGTFTLRLPGIDISKSNTIAIYSALGSKIWEQKVLNKDPLRIALHHDLAPNGLYILVLKTNDLMLEKKFIIQH